MVFRQAIGAGEGDALKDHAFDITPRGVVALEPDQFVGGGCRHAELGGILALLGPEIDFSSGGIDRPFAGFIDQGKGVLETEGGFVRPASGEAALFAVPDAGAGGRIEICHHSGAEDAELKEDDGEFDIAVRRQAAEQVLVFKRDGLALGRGCSEGECTAPIAPAVVIDTARAGGGDAVHVEEMEAPSFRDIGREDLALGLLGHVRGIGVGYLPAGDFAGRGEHRLLALGGEVIAAGIRRRQDERLVHLIDSAVQDGSAAARLAQGVARFSESGKWSIRSAGLAVISTG